MSAGRALPRVTEPDEGVVHYVSPPIMGSVTLCGLTDFIGHRRPGKPTDEACTCTPCLGIVAFVKSGG